MGELLTAYRLRWKRRRLLWRALRARHGMAAVRDRTAAIRPDATLCFACVRNEARLLPWFLDHHRQLGVGHFLIVDNGSDDGTADLLAAQSDVSLWTAPGNYRDTRFGLDWVMWLLARYGHGHWCLTLDADEGLTFPHDDSRTLRDLTAELDRRGQAALPALMLDMYPEGRIGNRVYQAGTDPFSDLCWFDAGGYRRQRQQPLDAGWVQGGPRARVFFPDDPRRAPTLNKLPLVRWNRRFAYVNSTHTMLPRRLNRVDLRPDAITGAILHAKFIDQVLPKAREDLVRRAHFHDPDALAGYYDRLLQAPVLHDDASVRLTGGWRQLEQLGLLSSGGWR